MKLRSVTLASVVSVAVWGCGSNQATPKPAPASPTANRTDGGSLRISIKHGQDPDASAINLTPQDISIHDLLSTKLPDDVKDVGEYDAKRIGPFEKSTYRVHGTVTSVVHRKDGDYFLVIADEKGFRAVMEVPDPKLCEGSPLASEIAETRKKIEDKYHPTDTQKEVNDPATFEGVGFFNWRGRQGSGGHSTTPRLMPGTGFKPG